jgi:RNA polymerase sigma factor (sigma-70 family)
LFVVVHVTGQVAGRLAAVDVELEGVQTTESFSEVFSREYSDMVRLAYLLLNSVELAKEAVQDSFARLLDRFGSVRNPGGFVRTATVNRCRDVLRRRGREDNILTRFRRTSEDESSAKVVAGDLHDLLAGLSQRKREVVVLRYYLGHSHAVIADLLGMKEPTVRTTLHRALTDLRGELT